MLSSAAVIAGLSETRARLAGVALAIALVAGLASLLHATGRGARRTLARHEVVSVRDGAGAVSAWRRAAVRGRTVLWLDRDLPVAAVPERAVAEFLRTPDAPAVEESFLYLAMRAGVVRRVVYLVPDERWAGYAEAARARAELHADGAGFVQFVEGVPIVSLPAREGLRRLDERVLLYVTPRAREFFGDALVDGLVSDPRLADVVLVRS